MVVLEAMQLSRKKLPVISESDLSVVQAVAIDVIDTESVEINEIELVSWIIYAQQSHENWVTLDEGFQIWSFFNPESLTKLLW